MGHQSVGNDSTKYSIVCVWASTRDVDTRFRSAPEVPMVPWIMYLVVPGVVALEDAAPRVSELPTSLKKVAVPEATFVPIHTSECLDITPFADVLANSSESSVFALVIIVHNKVFPDSVASAVAGTVPENINRCIYPADPPVGVPCMICRSPLSSSILLRRAVETFMDYAPLERVKPPITRIISPDTTDLAVVKRVADKRVLPLLCLADPVSTKQP